MLMILLDSAQRGFSHTEKVINVMDYVALSVVVASAIAIVTYIKVVRYKSEHYKYADAVLEKIYKKHSHIQKNRGNVPAVVQAMLNKFETIQNAGKNVSLYDFKDFVSGLNKQDLTELDNFVGWVGLNRSNPGSRIALKAMRKRFRQIKRETNRQLKQQKHR